MRYYTEPDKAETLLENYYIDKSQMSEIHRV